MSAIGSTRSRVLDHGLNLLSVAGFNGVTLGVLAARTGLSKSGLFAHFRSKEAVQLSLLQRNAELAHTQIVAPTLLAAPGLPRLVATFENWCGWAARAGLEGGCPLAAALFELDDQPGEVRDAVAAVEARWAEWLGGLVRKAVDLGHLRPDLDVDQIVWEIRGVYLAHHVASRFTRDPRSDERARKAFRALLDRAGAEADA